MSDKIEMDGEKLTRTIFIIIINHNSFSYLHQKCVWFYHVSYVLNEVDNCLIEYETEPWVGWAFWGKSYDFPPARITSGILNNILSWATCEQTSGDPKVGGEH